MTTRAREVFEAYFDRLYTQRDLANEVGVELEVWLGANHFAHWVDPALVARELTR